MNIEALYDLNLLTPEENFIKSSRIHCQGICVTSEITWCLKFFAAPVSKIIMLEGSTG